LIDPGQKSKIANMKALLCRIVNSIAD